MLIFVSFVAFAVFLNSCQGQTSSAPLTPDQKKKADISQKILDGLFEANNLPHPTTVLDCVDIKLIETYFDLINPVNTQKGQKLMSIAKDLYLNNPCSKNNQEVLTAFKAFGLTPGMQFGLSTGQLIQNLPYFQSEFAIFNQLFQEGEFIKYGYETSKFLHVMLEKAGVKQPLK